MKISLGIVLFGLAAAAAACGGGDDGSGIDQDKQLSSLSMDEITTFCEWAIAEQGGAGHQTMCGDIILTVANQAACESNYVNLTATCTATVADGEDCIAALATDPCSVGGNACTFLIECAGG
jgi:hypothetical protein